MRSAVEDDKPTARAQYARTLGQDRDRVRRMTEQRVGDDEIIGSLLGVQLRGAIDLECDTRVDALPRRVPTRGFDQIGADIRRLDGAVKAGRGGERARHDTGAASDLKRALYSLRFEIADVIGDNAAKERMFGAVLEPRRHDGQRAFVDFRGSAPDVRRCLCPGHGAASVSSANRAPCRSLLRSASSYRSRRACANMPASRPSRGRNRDARIDARSSRKSPPGFRSACRRSLPS